jgi:hypothetical protein
MEASRPGSIRALAVLLAAVYRARMSRAAAGVTGGVSPDEDGAPGEPASANAVPPPAATMIAAAAASAQRGGRRFGGRRGGQDGSWETGRNGGRGGAGGGMSIRSGATSTRVGGSGGLGVQVGMAGCGRAARVASGTVSGVSSRS